MDASLGLLCVIWLKVEHSSVRQSYDMRWHVTGMSYAVFSIVTTWTLKGELNGIVQEAPGLPA